MNPDQKLHLAAQLHKLPSRAARAIFCEGRAEGIRLAYQARMAEWVEYIKWSDSPRYKGLSLEAREMLGRQKWQQSAAAHEMIADDEFLRALANHYAAMSAARRENSEPRR